MQCRKRNSNGETTNDFGFFNKDWEAYKNGFGDIGSDYWIGLEILHNITSSSDTTWRMQACALQKTIYIYIYIYIYKTLYPKLISMPRYSMTMYFRYPFWIGMIRPMSLTTVISTWGRKNQSSVFPSPDMTMLDQRYPTHLPLEAKLAYRLQHTMKTMTIWEMETVPQNSLEVCFYFFRSFYMY